MWGGLKAAWSAGILADQKGRKTAEKTAVEMVAKKEGRTVESMDIL